MSVALTDVLIDLARPSARARYTKDPDLFLDNRGLSAAESAALANGSFGAIFAYAASTESTDPHQQFNRYIRTRDVLLVEDIVVENVSSLQEVEPSVEIHTENNDNTTASMGGTLFIDENGLLFRLQAA